MSVPTAASPADWLDPDRVVTEWPDLGRLTDLEPVGSGLLLHTDRGRFHLKRRPRARIRAEIWTLDQLHRRGLPVTRPLLTRSGHTHLNEPAEAWFIYPELPGTPLPRPLAQPGEAEVVASVCAELSLHLAELDVTTAIVEGMAVRPVTAATAGLPVQVIHRDFHAGNVLFVPGDDRWELSGLIDFDHLEIGPRIVDLVYLAGSIVAEICSTTHDPEAAADQFVRQWHRLIEGYQQVTHLTDHERAVSVEVLIEVERDFQEWFAATGDQHNADLTARLVALVTAMAPRLG